jgi:hypothetical protein
MADTLTGELTARLGWTWRDDTGPTDSSKLTYSQSLANGIADNQAEIKWNEVATELLDAATTTFDLTAVDRDLFGSTLTNVFYWVKAVLITVAAGSTGKLIVGDAASDEWSGPFGADGDTIEVQPGGCVMFAAPKTGWAVDDTNKNLKIAASGGDVTYSIAIIGTETDDGSGSGSAT